MAGNNTTITELRLAISCPISGRVMTDPVILRGTGYSFERRNIERWLAERGTDPKTNAPLSDIEQQLIPNPAMIGMIHTIVNLIRGLRARERLANERAGLPAEGPVEDA